MNKFSALILALTLSVCTTLAQKVKETNVPLTVLKAFKTKYPDTHAKWTKEKTNFEASFEINEQESSITYDAVGNILEVETEIEVAKLPQAVIQYVSTNMKGAKISEASIIVDAKGVKHYEAEIKGKDYLFDEKGSLLK